MGAKHKKTRKEKILADYRHQVYILKNKDTLLKNLAPSITTNTATEKLYSNVHILKDVLKTGILTCTIVVAQFILFLLLKRHILLIPNLNY